MICMNNVRFTAASMATAVSIVSAIDALGFAFSIRSKSRCRGADQRGNILLSSSTSTSENSLINYPEGQSVVEWSNVESSQRFNAQVFASSNCWGCRPFLMRGAFDPALLLDSCNENDDPAWPSWEEVVEIAADDDSESRIISHIPGDPASYNLEWGPLTGKDVRNWLSKTSHPSKLERSETLVVNDIDRFYPPLADWMHDTFRFLPNWRMDDGQISLAEQGGGIGLHVDNYDVFLIQMSGRRTWQTGQRKIKAQEETDRTIDGLDVRVLNEWGSDAGEDQMEEWIVFPGDLLYLPPRVAHCGTALSGDSMTLSVGCRAPSVSDLVSKLAERLSSSIEESAVRRYTDADLLREVDIDNSLGAPGELTLDAKERAKDLVIDSLTSIISDNEWWDEFFGRYVTTQKRFRSNYPIPLDDWVDGSGDVEDLSDDWNDAKSIVQSVLAGKGVLYHAEGIAFAFSCIPSTIQIGKKNHRFFVNGEMWQSESQANDCMARLFQIVANHRRLDQASLLGLKEVTPEAIKFLEDLISAGVLYGSEE